MIVSQDLFHCLAGKIAGLLAMGGLIPYCLAIFRGTNRPNRASWIIWLIVGFVLLASYKEAGATDALWVSMANVITLGVIVLLSLKYGEGGFGVFDLTCLTAAAFGLLLLTVHVDIKPFYPANLGRPLWSI